jgi:hypothetical protein
MMYQHDYDVRAKQEEIMRRANQQRLVDEVQKSASNNGFRRAIELLIGLMQPPAPALRPEPEQIEPVAQPRKLATDSGIHRIR